MANQLGATQLKPKLDISVNDIEWWAFENNGNAVRYDAKNNKFKCSCMWWVLRTVSGEFFCKHILAVKWAIERRVEVNDKPK